MKKSKKIGKSSKAVKVNRAKGTKKKVNAASKKKAVRSILSKTSSALKQLKKKVAPKPTRAVEKIQKPKILARPVVVKKIAKKPVKLTPFLLTQQKKLQELRDLLLDQMQDVAQGNLRAAPESGGGAAFGQHMGDAGSDAYEKDFALSLLSQEQDSLNEIEDALQRIEDGSYGICEKSGKTIPKARLEALPWARFTVECQAEMEKAMKGKHRWESVPQFMDMNEGSDEEDEEEGEEETRIRIKEE
ncbi:MAG: TraR/DksA family transcriptional regulator [Verrucomicrobiae bacterium]|nr:TraR/DksA family transcriptional regulator [Verrucomicrobiae bacterium]